MNALTLCLAVAVLGAAHAEPPSGYSYGRGGGGGGGGGSYSVGGGGGGGYQQVSPGGQTSEGQHVDGALLEQIRQILLREESNSQSSSGSSGGYPNSISTQYGVPSTQYGVPSTGYSRVVGVDLEGVRQGIQVAQYEQTSHASGTASYSRGPSTGYGAPAPSGSYGAPF